MLPADLVKRAEACALVGHRPPAGPPQTWVRCVQCGTEYQGKLDIPAPVPRPVKALRPRPDSFIAPMMPAPKVKRWL